MGGPAARVAHEIPAGWFYDVHRRSDPKSGFEGIVHLEVIPQSRDRKHLADPRIGDDDPHFSPCLVAMLLGSDQDAQSSRVDECDGRQVDYDRSAVLVNAFVEVVPQPRCRGDINFTLRCDDGHAPTPLLCNAELMYHHCAPQLADSDPNAAPNLSP